MFMKKIIWIVFILFSSGQLAVAQPAGSEEKQLTNKEKRIIGIAVLTGAGDLGGLQEELTLGLDDGLTINEIKELLIHVYAYAGFPRSLRGIQTFMAVLKQREDAGITDVQGATNTPVQSNQARYERGKKILEELTGVVEPDKKTGYAAFAPDIEVFLKEHLFADLFERDILNYTQRELVTVGVLSGIGAVEPMLRSHLGICLNIGMTAGQLREFADVVGHKVGKEKEDAVHTVLEELLQTKND